MTEPLQELPMLPEIVDETGKKITRPDVLQLVTQLAQLAQLAKMRTAVEGYIEKREFKGGVEPKDLDASDKLGHIDPFAPWITAYFFNAGPHPVYIGINYPYPGRKLEVGADYSIDFSGADRRIEIVYYRCEPGETALVNVAGKY